MSKHIKEFHFSNHGSSRANERTVSAKEAIEVILTPSKQKQQYKGTHGGFVTKFNKTIDGKNLAVVAELYKDQCYIVTTFYET